MHYGSVDKLDIESEETGFYLRVENEHGDVFIFDVQDVAEQLYDQARSRIGPWLRERDEARRAVASGVTLEQYAAGIVRPSVEEWRENGYDPSDPQHPDHHSVHADIWDVREGK